MTACRARAKTLTRLPPLIVAFSVSCTGSEPAGLNWAGRSSYTADELDGPFERYYENGQLEERGTYNMGEQCGEWIEDGETVTYPPCPHGGN